MFCLDTNTVIFAINERRPAIARRVEVEIAGGATLMIPAIVLYELHCGIAKSNQREKSLAVLNGFLVNGFQLPAFDETDAAQAALIRAHLEKRGTPIGPYDILIAAQARVRNAVLVTSNRRGFERVPGLMVTDWDAA